LSEASPGSVGSSVKTASKKKSQPAQVGFFIYFQKEMPNLLSFDTLT
jgi:hypothetical protein